MAIGIDLSRHLTHAGRDLREVTTYEEGLELAGQIGCEFEIDVTGLTQQEASALSDSVAQRVLRYSYIAIENDADEVIDASGAGNDDDGLALDDGEFHLVGSQINTKHFFTLRNGTIKPEDRNTMEFPGVGAREMPSSMLDYFLIKICDATGIHFHELPDGVALKISRIEGDDANGQFTLQIPKGPIKLEISGTISYTQPDVHVTEILGNFPSVGFGNVEVNANMRTIERVSAYARASVEAIKVGLVSHQRFDFSDAEVALLESIPQF
jgi:hypothetical protein